jgi:DNA-directed RNA polymerase specialized sigma subunit
MDKLKIYQMCLDSSILLTRNYEDLAHDTYIKIVTSDALERLDELKLHDKQIAFYIYKSCRSVFLTEKSKQTECELLIDPELIEDDSDQRIDPYEYILKIRKRLSEIERLWIEEYLDSEGNASMIARKLNIARQTVSKRVKTSCKKLK